MRLTLSPVILCSLLTVLLWSAAPARAEERSHLAALPASVGAGETVSIAWQALPGGVHEVELEASYDGGRWQRISPELEAAEGRFCWRVPADARGTVRLRLRMGGAFAESAGEPSAPVRIESALAAGPSRLPLDELWTARGGVGEGAASAWADGVPHLAAACSQTAAELPPRTDFASAPSQPGSTPHSAATRTCAAPASPARAARVFTPLRN